jgi:hypothetical protein
MNPRPAASLSFMVHMVPKVNPENQSVSPAHNA